MQGLPKTPGVLGDFAKRFIRHKARQLVGSYGFTGADYEDLRQEMTLDLLERSKNFDPTKSTHSRFVAGVVKRKISNLIRHRKQERRDYRRESCSLNDQVKSECGGTIARAETISPAQNALNSNSPRPTDEAFNLKLDVALVLEKLDPDLRLLAELLMTCTITEAARRLGVPRATIYEMGIFQLRTIFEDEGLREYL